MNNTVFLPGDSLYFEGDQTFPGSIFLNSSDANDPNHILFISSYGKGRAIINAGTSYGFYADNTQGISLSNLIFDGNSMSTNANAGIIFIADIPGDVKFRNISITNIEVKNFGTFGISISGMNNLTGYQNVVLSNLSVHDILANGIDISGFSSQTLVGWPNKNVSISNCEVYNITGFAYPSEHTGDGIVVSGVDGGSIQYCVAHDNGQNNSHCGGPAGIWCWDSNNFTIQYCESYRNHNGTGCDGAGFDLDGGTTNSLLQFDYSHDNDGPGFLMGQFPNARTWSNNTVRYNISENDGKTNGGSIHLFKGPGTTMSGANIFNNTIFASRQTSNGNQSAVFIQNWTTGINNVAFYNNIFITTGNTPLINIPSGYAAFFGGNIYWSSGGSFSINYQGTNYTSLLTWRSATGNEIVNSNSTGFNADPLLSNVGSGGTVGFGNNLSSLNAYKIQSNSSPAFAGALDLGALYAINVGNYDFWGSLLPGGSANNIGASQTSAPLPVKLIDFRASCSGAQHNLIWHTAEESNMKSFELMYSFDRIIFRKLADIIPKGTNSEYHYVNSQPSSGINYYQLRMIDLDDLVTYSNVADIKCEGSTDKISVWPNPFTQSIKISFESSSKNAATVTLVDSQGRLLSKKKVQLQEGNNQLSIDGMEDLSSGTYYLQIISQDKVMHVKLIKAGEGLN